MKNTLIDLNNHLFEQLERLNEEELDDEQLEKELKRSKAIADISRGIIDNAKLTLDVMKYSSDYLDPRSKEALPSMLDYKKQ